MPITISPNQIHIKKQDGSGFLPGNVVAGETTEQMCAAVEATGQATIDHVNQAVADAQSAVNTLDSQKNSIANTVASMAQLGTDTSLATPGMAADAAKTGEEVSDLKSAIVQNTGITGNVINDEVINILKEVTWEIGALNSSGQPNTGYDTRLRTINYIDVSYTNAIKCKIESGYKYKLYLYDRNYTYLGTGNWETTDKTVSTSGAAYLKVLVADTSDGTVSVSYSSKVTITIDNKVKESLSILEDRLNGIEYLFKLAPSITNSNVFIYNNDSKIYANTTNGFSLKAYPIKKGEKYICNGKSVATFNTFNYALVYFGVVYTDSEINLNSGTSFTFASKISVNSYTNPSDYSESFVAENNGYVIQFVIQDKFTADVVGIDHTEITELQNEITNVAGYQKKEIEITLMKLGFEQSEFSNLNNWSISNGKLTTSTAGVTNRATVDKSFSIEDRDTIIRFSSSDSSAKIGFGYLSPAYERGSSLFYLDYSGKMAICECFSDPTVIPNDRESKNITVTTGRDYIAVLGKRKKLNTFTIIDTLTGERYTISTESVSTSSLDNEFAGGRQNGYPFVVLLSGTNAEVKEWYATTHFDKPLIAVYGDSITEGDRLTNKQKRYADWLKDDFGYLNVSVSGMSGATVDMTKKQIQSEISATKPRIVVVGIGTNGSVRSVTKAKFDEIIAIIEAEGATAIINHIPMLSGTESITKNAVIETVETEHCLMDVATAKNNDVSQGQNTSMFADSAHPNEKGHKAMYQRFIIDSSIYHE